MSNETGAQRELDELLHSGPDATPDMLNRLPCSSGKKHNLESPSRFCSTME